METDRGESRGEMGSDREKMVQKGECIASKNKVRKSKVNENKVSESKVGESKISENKVKGNGVSKVKVAKVKGDEKKTGPAVSRGGEKMGASVAEKKVKKMGSKIRQDDNRLSRKASDEKALDKKARDKKASDRKTVDRKAPNVNSEVGRTEVGEKATERKTVRGSFSGERREAKSNGGKAQCPVFRKCGGCQYLNLSYEKQLDQKRKMLEELLKEVCPVKGMIGMDQPYHYRNKVHAVFDRDKKGNPISGVYKADSHIVVPVESCLIEDQKADEIIGTIRGMLKSFKIKTFDEDTGYGFLRHVLVKRGFATGEIMVVLVTASPIFPSKNNFVRALREKHPEITTIIQNVNNRFTSMVLGDKEHVLYGKGYIEDMLCGCVFRISSKSFYQVNPVQTEKLYDLAIKKAGLTGNETVIDAYCGIGTIGIVASRAAKRVIGVELNSDAVRDAVNNAKRNQISNIQFYCNDAGKFMRNMAEQGETVDVVFMDPPRSGSTEEFMDSVAVMRPKKVVYISCGPETLARDLKYFRKLGYAAVEGWGVDLFPWTGHCEVCVELCRK